MGKKVMSALVRLGCPNIYMGPHGRCPKASITFRALLCHVPKNGERKVNYE